VAVEVDLAANGAADVSVVGGADVGGRVAGAAGPGPVDDDPCAASWRRGRRSRSTLATTGVRRALRSLRSVRVVEPPARGAPVPGIGLDRALTRLLWRPARAVLAASVVAAFAAHGALAVAGGKMRPQRARAVAVEMTVAPALEDEVLADEARPPPPPADPVARSAPNVDAAPSAAALATPSLGRAVAGGVPTLGFSAARGAESESSSGGARSPGRRALPDEAALVPARAIERFPPRFPPAARAKGASGYVVVSLRVDTAGAVTEVRVLDARPAGVFDAAAVAAVERWRFEPATRAGRPVASWVKQTIRFELE
jgi:protein TonB